MYDYNLLEDRDVLCIDQKFCECIMYGKGLDPLTTKLAVVADTKSARFGRSSSNPKLKELGIKTDQDF